MLAARGHLDFGGLVHAAARRRRFPEFARVAAGALDSVQGGADGTVSSGVVGESCWRRHWQQQNAADAELDDWTCFESDAMRAHMLVFSRGVRTCLGKSIALMELKLLAAAVAQRFGTLRLADARQTVDDMEPTDRQLLLPRGRRCNIIFDD
jgi:hypothetical protein